MASRLVRGTAIACGVAVVAGAGIGFALGDPVQPEDILPARTLATDVCERIGDVSAMLPQASKAEVSLTQAGTSVITCAAQADPRSQRTYAAAQVKLTITPYGGRDFGAGRPPLDPAQNAKWTWDRSPLDAVPERPYPTKLSATAKGIAGQSWSVRAVVQRGDVVVNVEYTAYPVEQKSAEQAALVLADRAIWESK
ncbi:hypothetical protein ACIBL3_04520 [Kribbella sp. NPDC050124]|uniref:hypothetical protein n=1 Tax=Kribbella sp. NPDC050124 TaxID=3364114 RepID=UPI003789E2EE